MNRAPLIALGTVLLVGCSSGDVVSPPGADSDGGGADGKSPSDSAPGDTSAGDTSQPAPLEYSAYHIPAVWDRIEVLGKDSSRNLCFVLHLINPSSTTGGITMPSGWGLEYAEVLNDATACVKAYAGSATSAMPDSQSGMVSFMGSPPPTLDVDATLKWMSPPAWAPSSQHLKATAVPVN